MKLQQSPQLNIKNIRSNAAVGFGEVRGERAGKNVAVGFGEVRGKNIAFKGAGDLLTQGLRFLDTSPAWGATFVDFGFMVTPRTAVDFTRGPNAGLETMRREASGTVNHAAIGAYGLAAGAALALPFNKAFGVSAHKIFASNETLELLGKAWHNQVQSKNTAPLKNYLHDVIGNIKGIGKEKTEIVETLFKEINENKKFTKDGFAAAKSLLISSTGTESALKIGTVTSSVDTFLDDVFQVSKTFMKDKVKTVFEKTSDFSANTFIKSLKKLNVKRSIIGLAIGAGLGMCIQPFNMYLTKKKTGSDGFVGVGGEARKKDTSKKFFALKTAAAAAFGAMTMAVIGGKPSQLLNKIQFQGMSPTLNQFKLVYGLTIMSRLMSARDKDELREASIKDTLGYLNWLVLGNFVTKIAAGGLDRTLIKGFDKTKGFWKQVFKNPLLTRDEVLHKALKEAGKAVVENGKALKFGEMMKALPVDSLAKAKIKNLNIAQLAGYVYSGVVLGLGVPKLNIAITNYFNKKRKANQPNANTMFNPANIAFLSGKMSNTIKLNK